MIVVSTRSKIEILGKRILKDELIKTLHHTKLGENYLIAIPKDHYIASMILESKSFAVNFIDLKIYDSPNIDKFQEIEKEESETIDCPRIKGVDSFECELKHNIEFEDQMIFIGKIVKVIK